MDQRKMKYHVFEISTGYVETATIGSVTFYHNQGFDTVLEGLYDLGDKIKKSIETINGWHNQRVQERKSRLRECCETTLLANHNARYCAKCVGEIREFNHEITSEEVMKEINSMLRSTNDEYGYDLTQELEDFGWTTYSSNSSPFLRVQVNSYHWTPNLMSPRHNRHSALEWRVFECKEITNGWEHHPDHDFDATDAIEED